MFESARSVGVVLETDVLVVGSGPGGLVAALTAARAAESRARRRDIQMGGRCVAGRGWRHAPAAPSMRGAHSRYFLPYV